MNNRYKGDEGNDCLLSVDGTDCRFPKNGKKWSSHKFKGKGGVRYEVGLGIKSGDICWINGPYPCGAYPDINIFRMGLKHYLEEDERVEADLGYIGENPQTCKTPGALYSHDKVYVQMKKMVASRHETVNCRLKHFKCLAGVFRQSFDKHGACFRAIAVITQLAIENGEPLFDVHYSDVRQVY